MPGVERIRVWGAAVLLLMMPVAGVAADQAFVTTTDFVSGSSSVVLLDGLHTSTNDVASIHSDATVRYFDGLFYVVNRFGADNIQILDPDNSFSTVNQYSVGAGSDPHDILVVDGTKAYVTRYNLRELLIVEPLSGAQLGAIDLGGFSDGDGIPEMDYMIRVGGHVFVSVQRLNRDNFFTPTDESYLVVIDVVTDTVVDVDPITPGIVDPILLTGTNPFSEPILDVWGGRILVSCVGFFGLLDGGVDEVDPYALVSNGFIFEEAVAGGDLLDIELVAPDKGYAIIATPSFDTELISWEVPSGTPLTTLYSPGGYVLQDVEKAPFGDFALLSDRTPVNPGIRCYDTVSDVEITVNPVDVGLPPFDIAFNQAVQTGIDVDVPSVAYLGRSYPNPFNGSAAIPFALDREAFVRLAVYDVAGRQVRVLKEGNVAAGDYSERWDGRDEAQRAVPSGVYFVRFEANATREVSKIVVVR